MTCVEYMKWELQLLFLSLSDFSKSIIWKTFQAGYRSELSLNKLKGLIVLILEQEIRAREPFFTPRGSYAKKMIENHLVAVCNCSLTRPLRSQFAYVVAGGTEESEQIWSSLFALYSH